MKRPLSQLEKRIAWLLIHEPEVEFDAKKLENNEEDSYWVNFWDYSTIDFKVITGNSEWDCIDKAIEYTAIKNRIHNEFSDLYTLKIDNKISTYKLPVNIEYVDDIREAYWKTCKATGYAIHLNKPNQQYKPVFENGLIKNETIESLKLRKLDLFNTESKLLAFYAFISFSLPEFYFQEILDVPENIIPYLDCINKSTKNYQNFE